MRLAGTHGINRTRFSLYGGDDSLFKTMYIVLDSGQLTTGRLPAYYPPRPIPLRYTLFPDLMVRKQEGAMALACGSGRGRPKGVRGSDGATPRGRRVLTRVLSVCRMVRSRAAAG